MKGTTYKRCACKDDDGRQLGPSCPKLRGTKHGTWYYQARVPGQPNPVRKGGFRTQVEAEMALRKLQAKVSAGQDLGASQQTVGDYLTEWLAAKASLSPDTAKSYEAHIRLYLRPALGDLRLEELRDWHLEEMYAAMRLIGRDTTRATPVLRRILAARIQPLELARPLSPARLRRVHATLMSALNSAVRRRRLMYNPAEHVELASGKAPKAVVWTASRVDLWRRTGQRYKVAVWTPEQTGEFLDKVAEDRQYALWHLIAFRGLRRGEACSLPWSDVDLDTGTARIPGTKSDTSDRIISLDETTVAVLRAHRARQLEERLSWAEAWTDSGRVFTRPDGNAVDRNAISDRFDRLIINTGMPPIRLHDLRHTAASLTYRATRDLKLVSELMGHSGIQITGDIYTSIFEELEREAAEAVAALVPRSAAARAATTVFPSRSHQAREALGERVAARATPQVRDGGAAGARTRDRGIMSPLL
ncbi:MAG: phage integrase [Frankiales bacterium]|nr:phage integrase [Frankiales bacterium]